MDIPQEWFTIAVLATPLGAAAALRIFVEYTKGIVDMIFERVFGVKPKTFIYALVIGYVLVYGVSLILGTFDETWFANIFNGPLAAVLAKFMVDETK